MKKIYISIVLGLLFPATLFAQSCSWVCEDDTQTPTPQKNYRNLVQLSEVLPNPKGDDTTNEFIELHCISSATVDMKGWKIVDATGRGFMIQELSLSAGSYRALSRSVTRISLNNDSDTVTLLAPDGSVQDEVEYDGGVKEGFAYAFDVTWQWTSQPTPDAKNKIVRTNTAPTMSLSAKDVRVRVNEEFALTAEIEDADGDSVVVTWDFGDGTTTTGNEITHVYAEAGTFLIRTQAKDSQGASDDATVEAIVSAFDPNARLQLSELHPKPDTGQEEFFEIQNLELADVHLNGWQVSDESTIFTFGPEAVIPAQGFVVVYKSESKIALNDTGDAVHLLGPDGDERETVTYGTAQKGESYSLIGGAWDWVAPTPGMLNEAPANGIILGAQAASLPGRESTREEIAIKENVLTRYGPYGVIGVCGITLFYLLFRHWRQEVRAKADTAVYDDE